MSHRSHHRGSHHHGSHNFRFQDALIRHASSDKTANKIVLDAKADASKFFKRQKTLVRYYDGAKLPRSVGDHFSRNADKINDTSLFSIAHGMPKGAHLHIHFNSTLLPDVLLGYAAKMENMYIWSDIDLASRENFENCRIEFSLRHCETLWNEREKKLGIQAPGSRADRMKMHDKCGPDIFNKKYQGGTEMRYQHFREKWNSRSLLQPQRCDDWLISKLVFNKREVDDIYRKLDPSREETTDRDVTASGWPKDIHERYQNSPFYMQRKQAARAWDKFNSRTKMMKGLFNYEGAFRAYTRKCLEEFVRDNVQYAEIRPNFMPSNQILQDDGQKSNINNHRTMEIIIEEYKRFMVAVGDMTKAGVIKENRLLNEDGTVVLDEKTHLPLSNGHRPCFSGLKVIYCTPRSFSIEQVDAALDQCFEFKKQWPEYIAGFDLVGEEAYEKKYPLSYFKDIFFKFRRRCDREGVDIPFLFHCGETPDDIEDNLDWAVKYGSRRIGHGYALPRKPAIMEKMKQLNVCVETCPISNMTLGLTQSMTEHNVYKLLKNEVHCAVSSDNGTLFRSTLSHDFFEVMVGHDKINLYGWEQLALWSLEHACLDRVERERAQAEWQVRWKEFLGDIRRIYEAQGTRVEELPSQASRMERLQRAQQVSGFY